MGYDRFGGVQGDTGCLCNALRHAGIVSPHDGEPCDEALITGLCGGIGFMYFVFEYRGWPPMLTLALRSSSMPDAFLAAGLDRLGVETSRSETSSAKVAAGALERALDAGKPALCTLDVALVPYNGLPAEWAGMGPHVVGVVGRDGDHAWLDDRAGRPLRMSLADLAEARAGYRKGKHRLVTLDGPSAGFDLAAAVRDAIAATARGFHEAPYKGFAGNFGFAGMEKWRRLLTDARDKKGWPRVFDDPAKRYAGLRRVYECLQCEYTAPAGGRPLYADFLERAADVCGLPELGEVAASFRESGAVWSDVAARVEASDDAVGRGCRSAEEGVERLDTEDAGGAETAAAARAAFEARRALAAGCALDDAAASELCADLAERLDAVLAIERAAVERMAAAVAWPAR